MFNTILDIATAVCAVIATFISLKSIRMLVNENEQRRKLEQVRISVTPKDKIPNCVDEILFLKLAFCNESSLPISIMDLKLYFDGHEPISSPKIGEAGTLLPTSVPVTESLKRSDDSEIETHSIDSFSLPVTIAPFSSFSGYAAFRTGLQDSYILCNQDVILKVFTSRKNFEVTMHLGCANFSDFTYWDDGSQSGDACY